MKQRLIQAIFAIIFAALLAPSAWAYEIGYKGGFYFLSDDGKSKIQFSLGFKPAYEYTYTDDVRTPDINTFNMGASFNITGHVLSPKLNYFVLINLTNGQPLGLSVDANIVDPFQITAGYSIESYGVEASASGRKLPVPSKSITNSNFPIAFGTGMLFHGDITRFHYQIGIGNGNEEIKNKNKEMVLFYRLDLDILGAPGGDPEDFAYSETPQIGIGSAGFYDIGSDTENTGGRENDLLLLESDLQFKLLGVAMLAEFHYGYNVTLGNYDTGYLGMLSYFIIPKKLVIGGRYAAVIRTNGLFRPVAAKGFYLNLYESGGAISYYILERQVKAQIGYNAKFNNDGTPGRTDQTVSASLAVAF